VGVLGNDGVAEEATNLSEVFGCLGASGKGWARARSDGHDVGRPNALRPGDGEAVVEDFNGNAGWEGGLGGKPEQGAGFVEGGGDGGDRRRARRPGAGRGWRGTGRRCSWHEPEGVMDKIASMEFILSAGLKLQLNLR
jgi:hypothetical protein